MIANLFERNDQVPQASFDNIFIGAWLEKDVFLVEMQLLNIIFDIRS
jgi:hypothetical protein